MSKVNQVHQDILNQFYNANNTGGSLAQMRLELDANRYRAFRDAAVRADEAFLSALEVLVKGEFTADDFDRAIDEARSAVK